MSRSTTLMMVAVLSVIAAPARAQTCLGRPAFDDGPLQAVASYVRPYRSASYVGALAYGKPSAGFASVTLAHSTYENLDAGKNAASIGGGYQFAPISGNHFQICPIANLVRTSNDQRSGASRIESTGTGFDVGLALGTKTRLGASSELIPSVALTRSTVRVDGTTTNASGTSTHFVSSTSHDDLTVSAGILTNKRFAIVPFFIDPLGQPSTRITWGISFALNFGTPAR